MAERRPDRVRGQKDGEFWAWCDQEEFRLQRCARCHRFSWPVVALFLSIGLLSNRRSSAQQEFVPTIEPDLPGAIAAPQTKP